MTIIKHTIKCFYMELFFILGNTIKSHTDTFQFLNSVIRIIYDFYIQKINQNNNGSTMTALPIYVPITG